MPFIGRQPVIGNFQKCDSISVVNGQAAYTLQVGWVNVSPQSENHMLVSLNGILQAPVDSFTVSGSTLTFASNLVTGDVIDFVMILGNVLDLGVPSDNTVSLAKLTATGTKDATTFLRGDNTFAEAGGGKVVQYVEATDGTASTITTQIPFDNTIPQNTEGTEVESLTITPTSASNKLIITWSSFWSASNASGYVYALFQDSTSDALRAWFADHWAHGSNWVGTNIMQHTMIAGTTSATTFKIRGGPSGAYNMYQNSNAGSDLGSTSTFSTLSIMEVEV